MLNIFFSIKIIRQFRRAKKKIQEEQITESIIEKYYFLKSRGGTYPWIPLDPPLSKPISVLTPEVKTKMKISAIFVPSFDIILNA
jgi:hypothetical protein